MRTPERSRAILERYVRLLANKHIAELLHKMQKRVDVEEAGGPEQFACTVMALYLLGLKDASERRGFHLSDAAIMLAEMSNDPSPETIH